MKQSSDISVLIVTITLLHGCHWECFDKKIMFGMDEAGAERSASVQRKRKLPETEEDVIQWFTDLRSGQVLAGYNESDWDRLIQNVRDNLINGENLRNFKREDLQLLDVKLLGPQRTLLDRIEHLNRSFRSPEGSLTLMS
jgi:hypothetical protein